MLTIGEYFKVERRRKRATLSDLERSTKIRKEFLRAIEKMQWQVLPEYPVLLGFIKNIAKALDLPDDRAVALFRRDYPPPPPPSIPKPSIKKEFRWGPRLTFLLGVSVVILIVASYLFIQYLSFAAPPKLEIFEPTADQIVKKTTLKVIGKTDEDATIKVNNQSVIVDETGKFETELEIYEGTHEVEIIATSRSGKEARVSRTIKPELK